MSCFNSLSVKIQKHDGLPQMICQTCLDELAVVVKFKEKLVRSDAELRLQLLKRNENYQKLEDDTQPIPAIDIKTEHIVEPDINDFESNFVDDDEPGDDDGPDFKLPALPVSMTKTCTSCKNCGLTMSSPEEMYEHQRVHQCYTELKCGVCNISVSRRKSLRRHYKCTAHLSKVTVSVMNTDPRAQPNASNDGSVQEFKCLECDKVFNSLIGVRNHFISHLKAKKPKVEDTSEKEKIKYSCDLCPKSYTLKSVLREHMRIHCKEPFAICPHCGRHFSCVSNMKQHMLRHTNTKNFECVHCGKKFISKGELSGHIRTHTKLKPFVCDICGTSFTMSYSLKKHKRIHTNERPYPCDFCDKRFKVLETMKVHRRIHTGEKPYSCSFCGRSFTQKHDMTKHERIHTGKRLYGCKMCGKRFIQASTLATHIKGVHKGQSEPIMAPTEDTFPQIDVYQTN